MTSKTGVRGVLSFDAIHRGALMFIGVLVLLIAVSGCGRFGPMTPVAFDTLVHAPPLQVEDLEFICPEWEVEWGWEQDRAYFGAMDAASAVPGIWPVDHPDMKIISRFGVRRGSHRGGSRHHMGLDIKAPTNAPVMAAADGQVKACRTERRYGKMIIIEHDRGYETLYAHLNAILVKPGQRVSQGELIGKIGRTGNATTTHLHYEVIANGQHKDPENYLPDPALLLAETASGGP